MSFREATGHAQGVLDVAFDRSRAEEAELLGLLEDGDQLQRGLITTRRRGSSPSEMVSTPSISFTVS